MIRNYKATIVRSLPVHKPVVFTGGVACNAGVIRDEITAQARAASVWVPEADTVFEIVGQDSKYISPQGGKVADFQMNKICAAGTGSFVEEQAARMGIPIGGLRPAGAAGRAPPATLASAAPFLSRRPSCRPRAADPDLLLRAVLTGDVLYAALADMRAQLAPQAIPTWEELTRLAAQISALPPRSKSSGSRGKPAVRHLAQRGDFGHPRARGLSDRPYTPRRDALGALARQRHRRTGVARALEGAAHAARPRPRQRRGLQPRSREAHRGGRPQPRGLRGQSGPLPLRQGAGARRARRRGAPLRAAL